MDFTQILPIFIVIVGALTFLTNIITEVVKKLIRQIPAELLATIVALVLSGAAFGGYASYTGLQTTWWMWVATVVVGFAVSYSAQFGFDKLKALIDQYFKK